ncbi:The glycine cleavage system catalyzes the degradation of glycine (By similarity) [Musa troglodytarum]|uniref:Aminomethyltransferase n=1 Tax=Musa troglodytarum TaxID=320322 RepID=A0A9E7GH08_9LILI|nr:The glycine cleavage system catalyzes the degradation of glycine (By similarity) [Musa troglodytarum]
MRGGGLWQLGQCLFRRLAQSKSTTPKPRHFAAAPAAEPAELKKTVLHDFHVEHGGKMVPFAGWSMPLQYKDSIMDSTLHCRAAASLFDVSHMCGLSLRGRDCIPFLETLVVADLAGLRPGTGTLTVFTNERGGAIDDSVVTKVRDDHIYLVVNAGCRDKDLAHIAAHMEAFKAKGGAVDWHIHDERSLLALQGPLAAPVLQLLTKDDLSKIYFGEFCTLDIHGSHCFLTRTGYTGEDGFEISVPSEHALDLARAILEKSEGKVRLTGLGARDSLRLEAGLCLYGNDMDQHTTPVEAGLTWAIGKRRRAEGGFLGAEVILKQLEEGPPIRRVGFFSTGPPPRSHNEILNSSGEKIGEVTSGGFSPCLKKNIAMGYVKSGLHKPGTEVKIIIRGKSNDGVVTKMPFVPTKYYKPS